MAGGRRLHAGRSVLHGIARHQQDGLSILSRGGSAWWLHSGGLSCLVRGRVCRVASSSFHGRVCSAGWQGGSSICPFGGGVCRVAGGAPPSAPLGEGSAGWASIVSGTIQALSGEGSPCSGQVGRHERASSVTGLFHLVRGTQTLEFKGLRGGGGPSVLSGEGSDVWCTDCARSGACSHFAEGGRGVSRGRALEGMTRRGGKGRGGHAPSEDSWQAELKDASSQ